MGKLRFLSVIILFAASDLSGQSVLTLDQCIAIARERNPNMTIAANASRSSELADSEVRTGAYPQIRLNSNSLYAPTHGGLGYDPAITDGGLLSGRIIVDQSLYDGGIRSIRTEQSRIGMEESGLEARITERDLAYAVRAAYIELLRSRTEADLLRHSVSQLKDYLDLVNNLIRGGNASTTDLLKTRVQLSTATSSLRRSLAEYSQSRYVLSELTGISPDTSAEFVGSLDSMSFSRADTVIKSGSLRNLDLAASELTYSKSLLDVELAERERMPVISLTGDMGVMTSGDNLKLPRAERVPVFGYSLGVNIDVPIFNWGAVSYRIQQKQLESENRRLRSELLARSLTTELGKLRTQMADARDRLEAIRGTMKDAEDNFLLTKSKYAGGAGLAIEVLSAQQMLTDTRLSELQTLAELRLVDAQIEHLLTE